MPFGTFGVLFDTLGVLFGTLRVPNCTWPRRDAHAIVGRLLMLFQCVFHDVVFFEKTLLRL